MELIYGYRLRGIMRLLSKRWFGFVPPISFHQLCPGEYFVLLSG